MFGKCRLKLELWFQVEIFLCYLETHARVLYLKTDGNNHMNTPCGWFSVSINLQLRRLVQASSFSSSSEILFHLWSPNYKQGFSNKAPVPVTRLLPKIGRSQESLTPTVSQVILTPPSIFLVFESKVTEVGMVGSKHILFSTYSLALCLIICP